MNNNAVISVDILFIPKHFISGKYGILSKAIKTLVELYSNAFPNLIPRWFSGTVDSKSGTDSSS